MDLIRFNARNGMKDPCVVIESIWTADGREPPPELPPSYESAAVPVSSSTPQPRGGRRRSERSEFASNRYQEDRALFWDSVTQY
jgi:hypothetical protein